jgi:hypothetical protein
MADNKKDNDRPGGGDPDEAIRDMVEAALDLLDCHLTPAQRAVADHIYGLASEMENDLEDEDDNQGAGDDDDET